MIRHLAWPTADGPLHRVLILTGCLDGQLPWLNEMARYAKQLAPKHLIISGTEGFFVPESGKNLYLMNPGGWQQSRPRHAVLLYRAAAANDGDNSLWTARSVDAHHACARCRWSGAATLPAAVSKRSCWQRSTMLCDVKPCKIHAACDLGLYVLQVPAPSVRERTASRSTSSTRWMWAPSTCTSATWS